MDATSNTHEHVLRPLHNLATYPQQVRLLKRLEAKIVIVEVMIVIHRSIDCLGVLVDEPGNLFRDQRCRPALFVVVVPQEAARLGHGIGSVLVQVGHRNPCRQGGEIRVFLRHVGARLSSKRVHFGCGDAIVEALNDLLCDWHRVHILEVESIAEHPNPLGDVVKLHLLLLSISLDNKHLDDLHGDVGTQVTGLLRPRVLS
mmetsp:Transcript_107059/g.268336  ORF Transcript_107059/g.268336 Transcript_107059/m.268336 type:complete len:201 (-) Transcript_107059:5-607(-)